MENYDVGPVELNKSLLCTCRQAAGGESRASNSGSVVAQLSVKRYVTIIMKVAVVWQIFNGARSTVYEIA